MTDRRTQIADAGIHILSSRGARALTHLNVDRELDLAQGSTSYYARTRRDLIALIVNRLAERTAEEVLAEVRAAEVEVEDMRDLAVLAARGLAQTERRADDHRARFLLLLECRSDPELYGVLLRKTSVREHFTRVVVPILERMNVAEADARGADFAALLDALLMQRIARDAPADEEAIIFSFLSGLPRVGASSRK